MSTAPNATTFGPLQLAEMQQRRPDVRVIDVRTPAEFAGGHIAGSYNVPLPDLGQHRAELTARAAGPVVLVCQSGRRAETAHAQLARAGLTEISVLAGGVNAWSAQGRPLHREASSGWTIERQVRGVAGAIVATSIAASIVWPNARFVAGAIGLGLTVAALTDTCAMGSALARMPWNRQRGNTCDLPAVVTALTDPSPQEAPR